MKQARVGVAATRRSFFIAAAKGLAGVIAGASFLARGFRISPVSPDEKGKIRISINPMAIPRSRKGDTLNG